MTCRTLPRRNNVQINGNILNEYEEDKGKILLEVASQAAIEVIVEAKKYLTNSEDQIFFKITINKIYTKLIQTGLNVDLNEIETIAHYLKTS